MSLHPVESASVRLVFLEIQQLPHVLINPDKYVGLAFANPAGHTECVEFIKQTLTPKVVTSFWREGIKVKRLEVGEIDPVQRETAIATFVGGHYPQIGSTGMHAAIYLGQNAKGIQVLDQFRKQESVQSRTIPWTPTRAGLSNDGKAFSVIEW